MSRRRLRTTALMACLAVSAGAFANQPDSASGTQQVKTQAHEFGQTVRHDSVEFGHQVAHSAREAGHRFNAGMHRMGARFHRWWDGLRARQARAHSDSHRKPRWV